MRISIQAGAFVLAAVLVMPAPGGGQIPGGTRPGKAEKAVATDTVPRTPAPEARYGQYDFRLQTIDGQSVRLSDYAGKVVLVNIWAPWCQPCRTEARGLARLYSEFKSRGLVILGVAIQTSESAVRSFAAENGVSWAVGINDDILLSYGAVGLPDTYVFSGDGSLAKQFIGYTHEEVLRPLLDGMLPR